MEVAQELMMDQELRSHSCNFKANAIIIKLNLLASEQLLLLLLFPLFGNIENRNN